MLKQVLILATILAATRTLQGQEAKQPQGQAYPSNKSGTFVGGTLTFGQSRAVGESSPGVGWFSGLEGGYISARNEWNRIEASFEAGTGFANFKDKRKNTQIRLPINFYGLAKFGYAYSIGEKSFGVFRIGAGPATATYPSQGIAGSNSSESITGFKGMLGWDAVFPAGDALELTAGLNVRFLSFSGDKADSFQLNIPALSMGARLRL